MLLIDVIGFIAAGFVLTTFLMRTMLPLRIAGICGNVSFITYGLVAGLLPVVVLHAILLPINVYRLYEMLRLIRATREETEKGSDLDWLVRYGTSVSFKAGDTLFLRDAKAESMFVILSGRVRLIEPNVEVGPMAVIGEIGLFSPHGKRTATAVCTEDSALCEIRRTTVEQLVLQNPQFAFYLIGVVTHRLLDNLGQAEAKLARPGAAPEGG